MALRNQRYLAPLIALAAWLSVAPGHAFAQATTTLAAEPMTLSQVVANMVERNAERARELESYTGKRLYELNYVGLPAGLHADMTVDMTYNAPASKEFHVLSENGSRWIVNHVLRRLIDTEKEALEAQNRAGVELTPNNYEFTALAYEPDKGGCPYGLSVQPKVATKFLYRGRVWVDDKDFAICRIEAEPAKNPSFWIKKTEIHHVYQKVGDFWLPVENQSVSILRFDGRATLTIKYKDYEIRAAQASNATIDVPAGH